MMPVLATNDWWTIGLGIWSAVQTALLFAIGQIARRADDRTKKHEETAEKLVEQKFAHARAELVGLVDRLKDAMARTDERLAQGEKMFDRLHDRAEQLSERDRQVELGLVQRVEILHRDLIERCPTREEMATVMNQLATLRSMIDRAAPRARDGGRS